MSIKNFHKILLTVQLFGFIACGSLFAMETKYPEYVNTFLAEAQKNDPALVSSLSPIIRNYFTPKELPSRVINLGSFIPRTRIGVEQPGKKTEMAKIRELNKAIKEKNRGEIERILGYIDNNNIELNVKGYTYNPLVNAVADNDVETVQSLIKSGADVNFDVFGQGPVLKEATSPEMLETLIKNGAQISLATIEGRPFLMWLIENGKTALVDKLIEHQDINVTYPAFFQAKGTPLMEAVYDDKVEIVKNLLDKKADPNYKVFGENYKTALQIANDLDRQEIKKLLIEHGAIQ